MNQVLDIEFESILVDLFLLKSWRHRKGAGVQALPQTSVFTMLLAF